MSIENNLRWLVCNEESYLKIIDKAVYYDRDKYEKRGKKINFNLGDDYWEEKRVAYIEAETKFQEIGAQICKWEPAGFLHYGMSLKEMNEVIQNQFRRMIAENTFIREESLEGKRHLYYPENREGSNDISRVWGAEFLNSRLQKHTFLKAAKHIVVLKTGASEVQFNIYHDITNPENYPLMRLKNAYVLSERIDGKLGVDDCPYLDLLRELGYVDFGDLGNIIKTSDSKYYVVDTEIKSFNEPTKSDSKLYDLIFYLKRRFHVLLEGVNDRGKSSISLSLKDIHLDF